MDNGAPVCLQTGGLRFERTEMDDGTPPLQFIELAPATWSGTGASRSEGQVVAHSVTIKCLCLN